MYVDTAPSQVREVATLLALRAINEIRRAEGWCTLDDLPRGRHAWHSCPVARALGHDPKLIFEARQSRTILEWVGRFDAGMFPRYDLDYRHLDS